MELGQLIAAMSEDSAGRELLESDREPQQVLEELRSLDSAVAVPPPPTSSSSVAIARWLRHRRRCAIELPDVLLRSIRATVDQEGLEPLDVGERIAEVRSQVPAQHRGQFDELFEEARLTYRIRDERGVFSDIWASGIMRRAAVAGGRRLAAQGRIHVAEHFVDAGFEEMCSLLSGGDRPSADELAERYGWRNSHTAKDAPQVLGPPPPPQPDPSGLPPAAGRVMRAIGVGIESLFASSEAPHEDNLLHGLGASAGVYEGPARRVSGPDEFDRIKQGDVLVTESTSEAFNILLPLLGAIVTDSGGLLSHSAIVAREYGIPGSSAPRGDRAHQDGSTVRVDGDAGEVALQA